MTFIKVTLDEINQTPRLMMDALKAQFTQQDYDFLKSFKTGQPDWSLATNPQIQNLPAVKWKLQNIQKMPKDKHSIALKNLTAAMDVWL